MLLARIPFLAVHDLQDRLLRCGKACATVLLCFSFTSCGIGDNSCVTFVWNPGGIDSPDNPSCPFTQGNGMVNVQIDSSFASAPGPSSPNLRHVYVTLTGIEARASDVLGQDGSVPEWQQLAPRLAEKPQQVDLLENDGDSCSAHSISSSEIPAGVYAEIRLRIAADDGPRSDAPREVGNAETNACAGVGRNCVVTARGEIRSLILDGADPDLIVGPKQKEGELFRVLPDQVSRLSIQFNPYSSLAVPVGNAIRIIPQFTASTSDNCESKSPEQARSPAN